MESNELGLRNIVPYMIFKSFLDHYISMYCQYGKDADDAYGDDTVQKIYDSCCNLINGDYIKSIIDADRDINNLHFDLYRQLYIYFTTEYKASEYMTYMICHDIYVEYLADSIQVVA